MSRLVSVPHGALLQHGELPPGAPQGAVPPSTAPLVVGFDAALESLRSKDPAVAEELQCISARTLFGGEADAVLNLQHKLMQHVMLREQRDIHRELLGNGTLPERQRAAAFVACGNGGGAWAGVLPQLTNPRHPCSLPDQTFAVAMALRLGAPLFREPHLCGAGCGKEMDAYGHHLFRCTKLRAVNTRHAAVNTALIRVMSDAAKAGSGALPKKEALASAHFSQKPTDVDSEGRFRLRRADIILVNPTAPLAPPILVEIQVSHPDPAKIPAAQDLSKPATVTDAIEARKIKWRTDRLDIDPKLIVPAAFTTYGAVGRRLQACSSSSPTNRGIRATHPTQALTRLSCGRPSSASPWGCRSATPTASPSTLARPDASSTSRHGCWPRRGHRRLQQPLLEAAVEAPARRRRRRTSDPAVPSDPNCDAALGRR